MLFCLETISALFSSGSDWERVTCAKWLHHLLSNGSCPSEGEGSDAEFQLAEWRVQKCIMLLDCESEGHCHAWWTILNSSEAVISFGEQPLKNSHAQQYASLAE